MGELVLCIRTADPPLVQLDDLQQLHACSLDGVKDLQSRRKSVSTQSPGNDCTLPEYACLDIFHFFYLNVYPESGL